MIQKEDVLPHFYGLMWMELSPEVVVVGVGFVVVVVMVVAALEHFFTYYYTS